MAVWHEHLAKKKIYNSHSMELSKFFQSYYYWCWCEYEEEWWKSLKPYNEEKKIFLWLSEIARKIWGLGGGWRGNCYNFGLSYSLKFLGFTLFKFWGRLSFLKGCILRKLREIRSLTRVKVSKIFLNKIKKFQKKKFSKKYFFLMFFFLIIFILYFAYDQIIN